MSSHLVADLERVCDDMIVMAWSRVQVAAEVRERVATHQKVVGRGVDEYDLPDDVSVVEVDRVGDDCTVVLRADRPVADAAWSPEDISLDDMILAYMARAESSSATPGRGYAR